MQAARPHCPRDDDCRCFVVIFRAVFILRIAGVFDIRLRDDDLRPTRICPPAPPIKIDLPLRPPKIGRSGPNTEWVLGR